MKLTIINGIPDENFSEHEASLEKMVQEAKKVNEVSLYKIRDMNIAYCCGCFGCWIKTPGLCVIKDDMETILRSSIHSDYVIYVSPIIAGFITCQTKKVIDRHLPSLLPYIKIYDGECHHPKRYEKKQKLGLVILDDGKINEEEVQITTNIFRRYTRNMHAEKFFSAVVKTCDMGGIIDEISDR